MQVRDRSRIRVGSKFRSTSEFADRTKWWVIESLEGRGKCRRGHDQCNIAPAKKTNAKEQEEALWEYLQSGRMEFEHEVLEPEASKKARVLIGECREFLATASLMSMASVDPSISKHTDGVVDSIRALVRELEVRTEMCLGMSEVNR